VLWFHDRVPDSEAVDVLLRARPRPKNRKGAKDAKTTETNSHPARRPRAFSPIVGDDMKAPEPTRRLERSFPHSEFDPDSISPRALLPFAPAPLAAGTRLL
jgi:hypothetical protein